jgi:hypothetical protein
MTMECFCFVHALVQHAMLLCMQWPLTQLSPASWAGGAGNYSAYLSEMSMHRYLMSKLFSGPWSLIQTNEYNTDRY